MVFIHQPLLQFSISPCHLSSSAFCCMSLTGMSHTSIDINVNIEAMQPWEDQEKVALVTSNYRAPCKFAVRQL